MAKILDHKTGISLALTITMVMAAGSFWVIKAQVSDLRIEVATVQETVGVVREDVAFIKGVLEVQSKITRD